MAISKLSIVVRPFQSLRINRGAFGLEEKMTVAGMLRTLQMKQENRMIDLFLGGKAKKQIQKLKIRREKINKKPVVQPADDILAA